MIDRGYMKILVLAGLLVLGIQVRLLFLNRGSADSGTKWYLAITQTLAEWGIYLLLLIVLSTAVLQALRLFCSARGSVQPRMLD